MSATFTFEYTKDGSGGFSIGTSGNLDHNDLQNILPALQAKADSSDQLKALEALVADFERVALPNFYVGLRLARAAIAKAKGQ